MDGACKEAARWTSLLVAEVYYPNAKQPLSGILPQSSQLKPTVYNALNGLQNELTSKLNAPHLPASAGAAFANDPNLVNYEMFNSLLPATYNHEYNHYDQTFARRASKQPNAAPSNQPANQNQKLAYTNGALSSAASYSMPQYQELFNQYNAEFNLNNLNNQYLAAYQPNYNQQPQQYTAAAPAKQSKAVTPAQAQMQQLVDLYQQQFLKQQYLAQLAKSSPSKSNANAYNTLIDSLQSAASMNYPTIVSQSPSVGPAVGSQAMPQQSMIGGKLNDPKQNEIKPRSFDTVNHKILESTLMKSSYINNEETAASNVDKMNDQSSNQPADNNANGMQNQAATAGSPNGAEPNETGSSKESSEECDGYDQNGCYVIRVYYDWFLVNGSCKVSFRKF